MNLLLLGGNSLSNRDFILTANDKIGGLFAKVHVLNYRHWDNGDKLIDLPLELSNLAQQEFHDPQAVFAKSIGTVLAMQAIKKSIIKPKFLLLLGIPLGFIRDEFPEFGTILSKTDIPTTIIHNFNDPVGSSDEVQEFLAKSISTMTNCRFVVNTGDTHNYEDYTQLKKELTRLQTSV
jgi:hypothetical protein